MGRGVSSGSFQNRSVTLVVFQVPKIFIEKYLWIVEEWGGGTKNMSSPYTCPISIKFESNFFSHYSMYIYSNRVSWLFLTNEPSHLCGTRPSPYIENYSETKTITFITGTVNKNQQRPTRETIRERKDGFWFDSISIFWCKWKTPTWWKFPMNKYQ